MKKVIALALILAMCLSLCACGKSQEASKDVTAAASEPTEPSGENVIAFDSPVVVAEDDYVRVELVRFYQEHRLWSEKGYPQKADPATEGATLEKFVVFRFCNKSDHDLSIQMSDIYLGPDGADSFTTDDSPQDTAPGKNVLGHFLIRTGEQETLNSMEDLYCLDGDFYIWHKLDDGVLRDGYELKFSIPKALSPQADNTEAWTQFRDYLQEQGPVTVVTKEIKDSNSAGYHQVTIEAARDAIQIRYEDEVTTLVGRSSAFGKSVAAIALVPNGNTADVQVDYFLGGDDGNGHQTIRSCTTEYSWDIQNYRSGDELSLTADYKEVNENGASTKKEGTVLTLLLTDPCTDAAGVLSQTLAESGLELTMADLGFAAY